MGYSPGDSKRVGHNLANKQYLKWIANKDLLYSNSRGLCSMLHGSLDERSLRENGYKYMYG